MRYKIIHKTEYLFSEKVFLEPHYLRFKPKITPFSALDSFDLQLSVTPAGFSEQTDVENNIIHLYWFDGLHESLIIQSEAIVIVKEHNPFNFIFYPLSYASLPFSYSESVKTLLQPALSVTEISHDLIEYGEKIKKASSSDTLQFISNLTSKIHDDFVVETRLIGMPYEADKTFKLKKASCRDLSWMQIQLLRHMGIAARFVSGYYYIDIENPEFELHAWVEVFLPGAGWIGLDPSNGILTGNSHITISTSALPENTMPVTGTIRGDATSELSSNLIIQVL